MKAVIFDKDGTLFDYADFWGPIISRSARQGFSSFPSLSEQEVDELAYAFEVVFGVDRNKVSHKNGILFRHDKLLGNISKLVILALKHHLNPIKVAKVLFNLMDHVSDNIEQELEKASFPPVREIMEGLKKRGMIIAIVTNDMTDSTRKFLRKLEIEDLVDFLRCRDSACLSKPNPEAIRQLKEQYGLKSEEICMIGDTKIDMRFGRRGKVGRNIAVLTGSGDEKMLRKYSDAVYNNIMEISRDPLLFK